MENQLESNTQVYASNGKFCNNYGVASEDNTSRVYNQVECDTLEGIWFENGECLIATGGSYSYDCRTLNSLQFFTNVSKSKKTRQIKLEEHFESNKNLKCKHKY